MVISRDHHDVSGTDSPFRETSNVYDGSAFCAGVLAALRLKFELQDVCFQVSLSLLPFRRHGSP